jgi:hypothetical protein
MESNKYTFYIKVVALNEIYNFVVLSFFSFEDVKILKNNIKFQRLRKMENRFWNRPKVENWTVSIVEGPKLSGFGVRSWNPDFDKSWRL